MNNAILSIIVLIAAGGIFFGYVSPAWSGTIAEKETTLDAAKEALKESNNYQKRQETLSASYQAIEKKDIERLQTFLPDSVDNVGLILDLNGLAEKVRLSLLNIDVAGKGTESTQKNTTGTTAIGGVEPVGSVDLILSAAGTFNSLQDFLIGIENSLRLLDVRDVVIKGSDTGVHSYQMTIRLYWLR